MNLLREFFESIDEVGRFVSLTYLSEVWKLLLAYARDDTTLKLGGVRIEPCLLLVAELRLVAIARREASWRLRLIDKSTSLVFLRATLHRGKGGTIAQPSIINQWALGLFNLDRTIRSIKVGF